LPKFRSREAIGGARGIYAGREEERRGRLTAVKRRTPWFVGLLLAQASLALAAGLEVVLLGTGYPRPDPDRAGPSTAVIAGDDVYLVDAGRGVLMRYAALGLPYENIRAVFLTHLHSDHISGLPDVFTTTWLERSAPLELYGPEGVKGVADAVLEMFAVDIPIRRDLTEFRSAKGATFDARTVREGVVYRNEKVEVRAFLVDHAPVTPAFGYVFEGGGRKIVISGDTRPSENLVKHARGADVLVHEVYAPGHFEAKNPPRVAENLKRYHTSAEEVGEIAERAGVKLLVLSHIVSPEPENLRLIEEGVRKRFKGNFVMGKDLMRF
jgi:ribonuclease Z